MKLLRLLTAILFAFFLSLSKDVYAQTPSLGISVSPPTFEISANPGDTIRNVIRVQNLTDQPITITTDTRNFTAVGDEGAVGLTEEENSFSLAQWLSVDPSEVIIEARQSYNFNFAVNVPMNAEPGGHFGSLIFSTSSIKNTNGTGTSIAQEVGSLLLVKVSGSVKENLDFDSFVTKQNFYEYGPVDFELKFSNKGNVHVKPAGNITITDLLGNKVASIDVDSKNILPEASRRLFATWDKSLLIGKYTAVASLTYGQDKELLTMSTSFSVFPYKVAAGIFVGAVLAILVIFKMRKRLKLAFKVLFGK